MKERRTVPVSHYLQRCQNETVAGGGWHRWVGRQRGQALHAPSIPALAGMTSPRGPPVQWAPVGGPRFALGGWHRDPASAALPKRNSGGRWVVPVEVPCSWMAPRKPPPQVDGLAKCTQVDGPAKCGNWISPIHINARIEADSEEAPVCSHGRDEAGVQRLDCNSARSHSAPGNTAGSAVEWNNCSG